MEGKTSTIFSRPVLIFVAILIFVVVAYGAFLFGQNSNQKDSAESNTNITMQKPCVISGCSEQFCSEEGSEGGISTCEIPPGYECYQAGTCARQTDGKCGWMQTAQFVQCINQNDQNKAYYNDVVIPRETH